MTLAPGFRLGTYEVLGSLGAGGMGEVFRARDPHLTTVTAAGLVAIGTPAYMSPEHARGLPVDKRSDIWAFGCVLYEMLTGARAFSGQHVTDIVARVIEREPDFPTLPAHVPSRLVFDRSGRTYDVSSDGQRFLMFDAAPNVSDHPFAGMRRIDVVLDWARELKQ